MGVVTIAPVECVVTRLWGASCGWTPLGIGGASATHGWRGGESGGANGNGANGNGGSRVGSACGEPPSSRAAPCAGCGGAAIAEGGVRS